ncbi:MAG: glycosyltransferase family 4 protein [Thiohalocapsa sp.]|uniref:glycosyltransferase family 4 protein n=1 Tax=Thiohalocapsa sp. TaxID=2497641 RepID=UPI0025CD21A2|nr:glycosyltransferase family 4 protein [Thiohalocapsa sp.]MCG6941964.1 glycosyltransferase family 4 protein [Thiohalocapsa sp.]
MSRFQWLQHRPRSVGSGDIRGVNPSAVTPSASGGGSAGPGERRSAQRVALCVAVDWYFCLHWLPLAEALREEGFDVAVITEVTDAGCAARIRTAGLRLLPMRLSRKGLNPLVELRSVATLWRLLRRERPDLFHAIAQKPVLYGTLAARLAGVRAIVGTLAGMGFVFTSAALKARVLRPLVTAAYRLLLGAEHVRIIVQNPEDAQQLRHEAGIAPVLIRGAGVDLSRFRPAPEPPPPVTVILASRMLWDKGVQEFVDAARLLAARGIGARLVLVGKPDTGNPSAVPVERLRAWQAEGVVEWWGHRDDMSATLADAHIVCLPSYREGLPTILIEAAAAGLPLVASDVPGCREVVRHGSNGLLVPARDSVRLADALASLIEDAALRRRYGERSRQLAVSAFGIDEVASATLAVYRQVLPTTRENPHPRPGGGA